MLYQPEQGLLDELFRTTSLETQKKLKSEILFVVFVYLGCLYFIFIFLIYLLNLYVATYCIWGNLITSLCCDFVVKSSQVDFYCCPIYIQKHIGGVGGGDLIWMFFSSCFKCDGSDSYFEVNKGTLKITTRNEERGLLARSWYIRSVQGMT